MNANFRTRPFDIQCSRLPRKHSGFEVSTFSNLQFHTQTHPEGLISEEGTPHLPCSAFDVRRSMFDVRCFPTLDLAPKAFGVGHLRRPADPILAHPVHTPSVSRNTQYATFPTCLRTALHNKSLLLPPFTPKPFGADTNSATASSHRHRHRPTQALTRATNTDAEDNKLFTHPRKLFPADSTEMCASAHRPRSAPKAFGAASWTSQNMLKRPCPIHARSGNPGISGQRPFIPRPGGLAAPHLLSDGGPNRNPFLHAFRFPKHIPRPEGPKYNSLGRSEPHASAGPGDHTHKQPPKL